jgi:hypothetical protein
MRSRLVLSFLAAAISSLIGCAEPTPPPATTWQGWSDQERQSFYTTNQGSQLIPYRWFRALRQHDTNEPFAADQLQRYGYLNNPVSAANPENLPVGFTIDGSPDTGHLGMTCAACHSTQITYEGQTIRIDGGRTSADFQRFLTDLTKSAQATRDTPDRFAAFARDVIGADPTPAQITELRTNFSTWIASFAAFMSASLPDPSWGPGRLDAVGMIFNRVAGLDLNRPENYRKADAPVRYPFIWDAPKQDKTQWPGFAPNGRYIFGLTRNTGEVLGVFARFNPHKSTVSNRLRYDSSVNQDNLQSLEELVTKLAPPAWPAQLFGHDKPLADQGRHVFQAQCASCHQETYASPLPAECRMGDPKVRDAWATPLCDVGTDPRAASNAGRRAVNAGIMTGTSALPGIIPPLRRDAPYKDILANAVIGTILQNAVEDPFGAGRGAWRAIRQDIDELPGLAPPATNTAAAEARGRTALDGRLGQYAAAAQQPSGSGVYEGRVLRGIWAVAPYLHNGSVPNLWELLQPAAKRRASFMVGSREFDPKNVGFATDKSPFGATFTANPTNGNSNAGHEYGTGLSEADKWALIEYMKGL